ncbi:hypothetical protein QAD02_017547 [Eretmocerus hayati]|uniref:Uncharacterized protein n=1 Tax=Eretmocerus hayati TaxID=131215 RepID=A0ACC2PE79_9HYME|nr:hypothetical protein QAD02_017547 [Eretmocerus hayati]
MDVSSLRAAAKKANRRIRVLLSVNDEHRILKKSANIPDVVTSLTKTMQEVDGLELNVTAGNKLKLVSFLRTLKDEMVNKDLEKKIFLVLPTKPEHLAKKFELKELSKYVDLFTIPTHYLRDDDQVHRTFHPSRLMGLFDMLNTDSLVDLVHGMGAPKQKILISAPVRAYHFRLQDHANNIPRSQALDEEPETYDRQKLCNVMSKGEWTVERDEDLTGPYAFKNTTWIAFEDETSLKIKGKYVILRDLAGLALRDVESDRKNTCGAPLVVSVHQAMTEMKRKPRDAVFSSLEKDLKGSSSRYPRQVRTSDFRIVRVVDTEGNVQAVRENTQTAFTCTRQGYFTHPKSCNRFYRCVKFNQAVDDYSVFEFDCPEGLAFDEKTEICAWPGSLSKGSACPGSSEIEPVPRTRFKCPSHPGFYADPHNCRWFFACYDLGGPEMVPYEFRCPFGLVFDQSKLVCEWPWKVPGCNGPGHGDGSYTQNFGGYNQNSGIPQGGIVGLGGFVGQSGYSGQSPEGLGVYDNSNQAYNYDYSNYQGGSSSLANNAGFGPSSQNYNPSGSFAGPSSYDGQPQYITSNANGYPGQAPQNFAGPQPSQGVQNSYNQGNSGSSYTPFVFYNYDNEPAKPYNGQSGSYSNSNSDYDSQKYNNPDSSATYNGQSYAGPRPNDHYPTYYDQQPVYPGKNNQNVPNYNNQIYNNNNGNKNPANAKPEKFDDNAAKNNGKPAKSDYDSTSYSANAQDYDDQRGTNFNNGITSQTSIYASNGIQTTQVNSEKFATTAGLENYAGTTQTPVNYQTNSPDTFKTTNSAADYFDSQRSNGATSTYGGPGKDEGFKDATGTNNYAGNSAADYDTNANRVTTGNNYIGISNAKQNSVQYMQRENEIFGSNIAGSKYPSYNVDYSQTNQKQNSGFNGLGASSQYGNSAIQYTTNTVSGQNSLINQVPNRAVSSISQTNSIDSHITGLSTAGNTKFSGQTGPFTYNSTFYAASGYPTSSLLPFITTPNPIHTADYNGAPIINSIIYKPQLEMGLSSSEYFGNEYPNQAEKSLTSQGRMQNLATFSSTRKNESNYDFDKGFPFVQNSNTKLAGIAPANNAASTISPSKLEDDSVQTDVYKNSDVFGQTTLGFNNEITKFSQSTKIPQDFGLSGTTSVDESFRTNYASNTQYNQGTTIGRNPFAGFGGVTPAGPSVTPGRIEQNYNAEDSTIPGVVPLNNQKTEGPNDFGSYKTNYAGFTTSYTKSEEDSGYKTNEYHDNGGRGTIRYNNGVVTSKVTQGYNTSPFTERTNSFNNNNFNKQSTLSPLDGQNNNDLKQFTEGVYTKGGFTKTGPTKTGITTAQVGGSGSYIIGTGTPRQRPDPAYIGEHAFTGSSASSKPGFNSDIVRTTPTPLADATGTTYGNAKFEENSGFTKSPNNYNNVGSLYNPAKPNEKYPANEYSRDDTKSNDKNGFKGYSYPTPAYNDKSKGYSYPKPVVELETADLSNANPEPTQNKYFDGTTAYPFSGNQPSKYNAENYGTTARPLAFTTDQMENFRTTVYQAAKIAQETSTLKPVIDNGYKSVILSTPVPAVISTQSYQSDEITTREQTYLDVGVTFGQNDYYNQDNSDYPDTFTTSNQGSFGQRIVTQTNLAQTQFYQSTQNPQVFNQNNELRPFSQKNNFPAPNKGQQNFRPENQPFSPKTVVPLPKQVYVSPKAVTPAVGVTYANPIVAADFRQRQPNQETTPSLSTITDPPVSVQKGLNYRILQQRPANDVANNQVQGYYGSQTELNGGPRNQAPTGFVPQAYSQTFYNSEGQTDFNQQRYNNVRVNNQNPPSYVHQTSSTGYSDSRYGQNSALYRAQNSPASNAESSQSLHNQNTGNSVSGQGQGFSGQTRTLIGSNVITSIGSFSSENSNQNGANAGEQRILAEFNNVNSKKSQQSTTSAPEITTFGGQYGSTQTTRTKSNEASRSRDQNKKVVVKLSDLHPLILGKLNAECTCKADPFALLRGPDRQSLPVNSQNRGRVDLANYDESDIYVDLDGDQRSQAETEFVRNLPASQVLSSSRVQFKSGTRDRNGGLKGPAPGYLPAAAPSKEYLPSTTVPEFTPITEEDSDANSYPRSLFVKVDNVGSASYTRSRTGKALVSGAPVNNVKTQNELVKSLKSREDTAGLECARPGLFRHPKQCNKFYACHWDEWKRRYTLHVFNCPVHLAFDSSAGACNFPSKGPACQDNKLLL